MRSTSEKNKKKTMNTASALMLYVTMLFFFLSHNRYLLRKDSLCLCALSYVCLHSCVSVCWGSRMIDRKNRWGMKPLLQIPTWGIPAFVFPLSSVRRVDESFSCCAGHSPLLWSCTSCVQKRVIHYI